MLLISRTTGCMQEALHSSEMGDRIILGEGEHSISGAGGLEEGGRIVGIGDSKKTVLRTKESTSGPSALDFSGGEVTIDPRMIANKFITKFLKFLILCL